MNYLIEKEVAFIGVYALALITIYLLIGVIVAYKAPYSKDVPMKDNVQLVLLWFPIFLYTFLVKKGF